MAQFIRLTGDYVTWMIAKIEKHYPELDIEAFKAEHSYDDIRKKFPGEHVAPHGCLLLAMQNEHVVGCIALGRLSETIGEVRTLFVQASARGGGIGKQLVEAILQQGRNFSYDTLRLDTLAFMQSAFKLYQSVGFYEIEAYLDMDESLKKYIRFLELKLEK